MKAGTVPSRWIGVLLPHMIERRASGRAVGYLNINSLQSHILQGEAAAEGSTGDFTWILSAISLAAKAIAARVRMARIEDVLGDSAGANVHGEKQQKLDLIANELLMRCL